MPLSLDSIGHVPKESPIVSETSLVWTMNFAAGCADCSPAFMDNRPEKGRPIVHPLLYGACFEVVGAFASLYGGGLTKEEVTRNTFVHHVFDTTFHQHPSPGVCVQTDVRLSSLQEKRKGVYTGTTFVHKDRATGHVIANGFWGGVVLGLKLQPGKSTENRSVPYPTPPPRHTGPFEEEVVLDIPAQAAHVWDACIRDPRVPKSRATDINVHTNLDFAEKAGLPGRTLTGLCLLGMAVSRIISTTGREANRVKRIHCRFAAPVYILFDDIHLVLQIQQSSTDKNQVHFQVLIPSPSSVDEPGNPKNKAIKDGFLEFLSSANL